MKVTHSWLKDYIGDIIPPVEKIEELLTFHAFEVEGVEKVGQEDVIEIKILPDRGSDCLSHRGIARELASITGVPLQTDPLLNTERLPLFDAISVTIADTYACSRFGAALVTGITVTDSPQWLKDRLIALGQRPINNIVDATNYVMYSLGQPLHAYDADKFPLQDGKWQFGVRFAKEGEKVSLIAEGGKNEDRIVECIGTELLIIDESANRPIGLAGVKGGSYAGVDTATTKIIIEAAHFDAITTRKTARRLGIVIDASKRFENNPSASLIPHALREVARLIEEIAGGQCGGSIDVDYSVKNEEVTIVRIEQVNALLGISLSKTEMISILERIGATVEDKGDTLALISPFERSDLHIAEDYIEEIGRLHGYSHVTSVVPPTAELTEYNARHYYSEKVRNALIAEGFSEVITSSFAKKDTIQLRNAFASDKSYLRSNVRTSLQDVLDKNANLGDLLGFTSTRVFEIGTVFTKENGVVTEHVSLCFGVQTKVSGYSQKDDILLEEVIERLQTNLGGTLSFEKEKGIAECNLTTVISKLPMPNEYDKVEVAKEIVYVPFSLYPAMSRDIALWVIEGTLPSEVEEIINAHAGALRVRTTFVDEFSKEGRTSFAFRLVFQSYEKTLTDEEVNAVMDGVYEAVQGKGWEVR